MGNLIRSVLPQRWIEIGRRARTFIIVRREFGRDRRRYLKFCLSGETGSLGLRGGNLEAQLTKDYHRVEKGLALRDPKRPFGSEVLARLNALIPVGQHADLDEDVLSHAKTARDALCGWNDAGTVDESVAPIRPSTKEPLDNPDVFFFSRRSVRDFEERRVERSLIERAVGLAISTPSVCNRQSWRVRLYEGDDVGSVLRFQNGNRGFTDAIPTVAIVTVDLSLFAAAGERNQPWIEGGLFAMSFVWALHALGVDSCMLNMSVRTKVADGLRRETGIPDNEVIIMMIAIGHGRTGHRIARSPRRAIDGVLVRTPS